MGEHSKISWTDHTFNSWWGCQRVSPGCEHCYAESFSKRLGKSLWGPTAERQVASESHWKQPLAWNLKAANKGQRARVFCASMADVFEDRPELAQPRARLFRLIEQTPCLDWLILTKRPENMVAMGKAGGWNRWPPHVWAGCTVENQAMASKRIPELLNVPALIRFLSCEPLLEPLDLREWLGKQDKFMASRMDLPLTGEIDWLIVGGESGPGARPFDLAWARDLRRQCRDSRTAFFCKQLGSNPLVVEGSRDAKGWGADGATGFCDDLGKIHLVSRKGDNPEEWPEDLRVQEFPR